MEAVVVSQLAESFSILFSLRATNTQERGEERLPTAKLFSQLSQQVNETCFLSPYAAQTQYTFDSTHTRAHSREHHVLLLDSRHRSVQVHPWCIAERVHSDENKNLRNWMKHIRCFSCFTFSVLCEHSFLVHYSARIEKNITFNAYAPGPDEYGDLFYFLLTTCQPPLLLCAITVLRSALSSSRRAVKYKTGSEHRLVLQAHSCACLCVDRLLLPCVLSHTYRNLLIRPEFPQCFILFLTFCFNLRPCSHWLIVVILCSAVDNIHMSCIQLV